MAKNLAVEQALERMGFQSIGAHHYGKWNGYPCSVHQNAPYCYLDVAVRLEKKDKTIEKALRRTLKERCPKKLHGCVNHGNYLTFVLSVEKKTPADEQLRIILDEIAHALEEADVVPADTCAVCGKDHPDSLCMMSTYQPVHAACVLSMGDSARKNTEENAIKERYLTGTIGALFGVLVGLVPSLLSILLFDRIYTVLFVIVPLLAVLGYRKFHGKRSGVSILIVIILSLAGVVMLEFLAVAISFKQELGLSLMQALRYTLGYLFSVMGIGVLLQENLAELLFMAIGIFISWPFLVQTNHRKKEHADMISSTICPLGNEADDPDWSEK